MRRYSSSLILLAILVATTRADITTTWNGTTGNWTDSARWSGGTFPNNSAPNTYHAVINAGTVTLAQAVIIDRFTLGGGTLTGNGNVTLATGQVNSVTGNATIGGGTIFGGMGATISVQGGATLTMLDGANLFAQVSSPAYTLQNAGTFIARNTSGPGFTTVDAAVNSTGTLRVENTATSHTLSLPAGGTIGGNVHLDAGTTLELGATFAISAGASFTGTGTVVVAGNTTVGGATKFPNLSIATGQLRLTGQTVTVAGSASVEDFGSLAVEIRGIGALAGKLTAGGTLSAYGTLSVTLGNGFTPSVGDVFDILDFASLGGTFSNVQLPALPSGRFWRTDSLYSEGKLIVSATPSNYVAWQAANGAGAFTADDDKDGIANGLEYALGLPPKVGGPSPVTASIAANHLRLHFQMPEPGATDATLVVEASDDFGRTDPWTPIATKAGGAGWIGPAPVTLTPAAGGKVNVTVQDNDLVSDTRARFLRLRSQLP